MMKEDVVWCEVSGGIRGRLDQQRPGAHKSQQLSSSTQKKENNLRNVLCL